jgi:hypothetical protein
MELKDWLNSINFNKNNLVEEDPDCISKYPPFIVNKCLSGELDSLMYANEMNKVPFLPKKLQYDFLLNSLRKRKRYLECVKSYYGYSNEKALQALKILSKTQIDFIKSKLETGGKK